MDEVLSCNMNRTELATRFRFKVEIDGLIVGHFSAVTGIKSEIEVLSQQEGGRNLNPHKLPGQGSFGELTLKRGFTLDSTFWDWMRSVQDLGRSPKAIRCNVDVLILSDDLKELKRFTLRNAWPAKFSTEDLSSEKGEIFLESLELVHEGMRSSKSKALGSSLKGLQLGQTLQEAASSAAERWRDSIQQAGQEILDGLQERTQSTLALIEEGLEEASAFLERPGELLSDVQDLIEGLMDPATSSADELAAQVRSQMEEGQAVAHSSLGLVSPPDTAVSSLDASRSSTTESPTPPGASSQPTPPAPAEAQRQAEVSASGQGFARVGAPIQAPGASTPSAWSDGVLASQSPGAFEEPGSLSPSY